MFNLTDPLPVQYDNGIKIALTFSLLREMTQPLEIAKRISKSKLKL